MAYAELNFLGILNRGGKTKIGEPLIRGLDKIKLLYVATDAKGSLKEDMLRKAKNERIVVIEFFSKEQLGSSIGYSEVAYLGVTDKKAAVKLIEIHGKETAS